MLTARYIISASGGLISPKAPDIQGLDTFKGRVIHTGYWDENYDFTGKRVAVIGTGATAVQMVPELARKVAHLDVYQRTPIWVLKKPDAEIPGWMRSTFRALPVAQRAVRLVCESAGAAPLAGAALRDPAGRRAGADGRDRGQRGRRRARRACGERRTMGPCFRVPLEPRSGATRCRSVRTPR